MDKEFVRVAKMAIESDLSIEIIFDALRNIKDISNATPRLALEIAIADWEK